MIRHTLIFIFILGFVLGRSTTPKNETKPISCSECKTCPDQEIKKIAPIATPAPIKKMQYALMNSLEDNNAKPVDKPHPTAIETKRKKAIQPQSYEANITFSEELINQMEALGNDLRQQAVLSREARGWRVHEISENSIFLKSGAHIDDLIPYEAIQNLYRTQTEDADALLTERLTQLLNYLSK